MTTDSATAQPHQAFDEKAWREQCETLSQQAQRGCGLVFEIYQRSLSASIDSLLERVTDEHQQTAIRIARTEFNYLTPEEIQKEIQSDFENGYCSHGLDPYWCPAGCGDLDEWND